MVEMLIDACEDGEVSKKEKADLEAFGQQGLRFRVQDLGFITQVLILTAAVYHCYWPRRPVTSRKVRPRPGPSLLALAMFRALSNTWKSEKCWCRQHF